MRKWVGFVWLLVILAGACTTDDSERQLPTRVILPTERPQGITSPIPIPTQAAPIVHTATPAQTITPRAVAVTATFDLPPVQPSATSSDTPTPTETFTPTPSPTMSPTPSGDAVVTNGAGANLRSGPGTQFEPPLALLPAGAPLYLIGISMDSQWYQARTADGTLGWVSVEMVQTHQTDVYLPIMWMPTPTPQPVVMATAQPVYVDPGVGGVSQRTREIFGLGRQYGNRANAFSKVGDSTTLDQPFLYGFDEGAYHLGGYAYLQSAVNFFAGSFGRVSVATFPGASAAGVLDPIRATDPACMPNETPLACEFRIHKPSLALITLGIGDTQSYDEGVYRDLMARVLDYTISQGVVPVLSTWPAHPLFVEGRGEAYNDVLRSLAAQYQIPLIDVRPSVMALPGWGVVPEDGFHLSVRDDRYIDFNGEQSQWGMTMRNLMTLQMLNTLMQNIPMN